jgi:hypothetical protein
MNNLNDERRTLSAPPAVRNHTAWADWMCYHRRNQQVMRAIVTELDKAKQAGRAKASVKAIINYLRWNLYIESGEDYKINDKYTGIYTHMVYHNWPEYREMIEIRELRSIVSEVHPIP